MTVLSSAAVILLILFIVFILLRANHDLARAQEEGEHFVDEWAEREEKLEEKRRRRKAREEQLMQMEQDWQEAEDSGMALYGQTGHVSSRRSPVQDCSVDESSVNENFLPKGPAERNIVPETFPQGNILPSGFMEREETSFLTLVKLDQSKNILRKISVDHIPFRIGRSSDNDMVLEDLCVSRQHIAIENRQGHMVAVDLGTRNKIFCEGKLVNQLVLEPGLHFFVGNVELVVEKNG